MSAKNTIIIFAIVGLLWSCKSDLQKKRERIVASIEKEGINDFLNIEFHTRKNIEYYDYFKADTVFCSWQFNADSAKFVNYDSILLRKISDDPTQYIENLRSKIKTLNLELISQSNWKGQVVKFWIADNEYFTYVHPDFKFDDGSKTLLKNELNESEKINENWFYKRLKVCRNK